MENLEAHRAITAETDSEPHAGFSRAIPSGEERYRLLFEAGQQLSSTLDAATVCERLRSLVSRVMPCDGIIVSSYDSSDNLIRCEYAFSGGSVLDAKALPALPLSPPGTGMQSEVIRSGKPMRFGDVAQRVKDPRGKFMHVSPDGTTRDLKDSDPPPTQCAIMVPVLLNGQVTGVVQIMTDEAGAYSDDQLELLEGLVLLLGAAIQNSKLYAKVNSELFERQKAEEALRESEAKYRFLAEAGPGYTWVADANFKATYANHRWLELLGKSLEEIAADGWQAIIHPDDLEPLLKSWNEAREAMREWSFRHRVLLPLGGVRWVHSRAQPHQNSVGELHEWFGLTIDIAEQKRTEAQLEQRVKERTQELEAANRELEGFTFSVSHDLRGPLRAIMSTSMILKEDYSAALPEEAKEQLERQARAARKLGDLIDDLLKLSRLARQEVHKQPLDLSAMANEILAEHREHVKCEVAGDLHALADAKLMTLALQNMLDNSLKFTRNTTDPQIFVGRREDGAFYVRDNGIGIDMRYSDKLFLPFERLVLDSDYPGTGIGLANVRRIIDRHGGKVWAESEGIGHGSTFCFTLPE